MKLIISSFSLLIATFFISCGENTQTPVITDVASIAIDQRTPKIYSTDAATSLTATVTYNDNTTAVATKGVTWTNSEYNVASMIGGIVNGYGGVDSYTNTGYGNGGDSNITITHHDFTDYVTLHVVKLKDFNISNANITTTGEHQLEARGSFEDNETNRLIVKNIVWTATNDAVIVTEDDISKITINNTGDTNVTATVFDNNGSYTHAPNPITITYTIN